MESFTCCIGNDVSVKDRYGDDYDGELLVWVAGELLSFGDLTICTEYMRDLDPGAIAKTLGVKAGILDAKLDPLNDLRNACAHHRRIWNREFELNGELIVMERVIGIVATLLHALGVRNSPPYAAACNPSQPTYPTTWSHPASFGRTHN
ncbi:Abi family protein [Bifidobacterium oedipodis]|uniref:DNA-binding protein n=1 Tax=Bifidobacterium oedipodis TaxID=2675322 RepID=A0A7Y0HSK9_9BIFI|nr:Abi family protein [Bifidobacterium sp. DSM 109957]NMM93122.1 DNA-binding protein [Bifidobacterium sp. DSM 109957]